MKIDQNDREFEKLVDDVNSRGKERLDSAKKPLKMIGPISTNRNM